MDSLIGYRRGVATLVLVFAVVVDAVATITAIEVWSRLRDVVREAGIPPRPRSAVRGRGVDVVVVVTEMSFFGRVCRASRSGGVLTASLTPLTLAVVPLPEGGFDEAGLAGRAGRIRRVGPVLVFAEEFLVGGLISGTRLTLSLAHSLETPDETVATDVNFDDAQFFQ